MTGVAAGDSAIVGFLHRPDTTMLTIAVLAAVLAAVLHVVAERTTRAPIDAADADRRPEPADDRGIEPPAVVALLTNDFSTPNTAVTATALDLAVRGWLRITTVDGEIAVVTRGQAASGDSLLPFEQQVLNHLASRAFNDVISAGTIAVAQRRLDRRWWLRFRRAVSAHAVDRGLTSARYTAVELAPAGAAVGFGLIAAWFAARRGEQIAISESWVSRTIWAVVFVGLLVLAGRTLERAIGGAQRPTDEGRSRAAAWLGHRRRLRERIPAHAGVLAPPAQQQALAHASVMGLAPQVLDQLPIAPEDHRAAWSEAGGVAHLVRVRYPVRPGYGQPPLKVAIVGLVVLAAARWLQGFLRRVGDEEALTSLLDRIPGQTGLVTTLADVLAVVCWVPVVWGVWATIAGAIDSIVTRERLGAVVRARRPSEVLPPVLQTVVKPFAERDRFSTYLAVDDGRRRTVVAWLAGERTAAPQGAQARVRATPLLGYVRASEPAGTAARHDG